MALTAHQPHAATTAAVNAAATAAPSLLLLPPQKFLNAARSSTQVTAVTFGAPNVGDAAFVSDYNSRVNTRNVQFFADIVPQVRLGCLWSLGYGVSMSGTVATVLVLWCVAIPCGLVALWVVFRHPQHPVVCRHRHTGEACASLGDAGLWAAAWDGLVNVECGWSPYTTPLGLTTQQP